MASNILPTVSALLIALGTRMKAGLVSLGSALGITQVTPAGFQALLDAFIASDAAYIAARSAKQAASDGYQQEVTQLTDWLQKDAQRPGRCIPSALVDGVGPGGVY